MDSKDTILTQISAVELHGTDDLLRMLYPPTQDASEIVVSVDPRHYSAATIARAIEDCDANLVNLNVLADANDAGDRLVALRVDHRNAMAVARSLERYGLTVVAVGGATNADEDAVDPYTEVARARALQLLRMLEV